MDFDSTELGFGMSFSSARGQIPGVGFPADTLQQATSFTFTPTRAGTFQFFCRVHPAMRGVFEVVP
jgi:plastocyanin